MSTGPTIDTTLGYPSPNALRSWYKEYKATGTLHEKSRPKPRYTQAQKEKAVSYYAEHRISITQACREMCKNRRPNPICTVFEHRFHALRPHLVFGCLIS